MQALDMWPVRRPILGVAGVALLSGLAAAQHAIARNHAVAAALCQGAGVAQLSDGLWATGSAYKARFSAAGVSFVPALGARATVSRPLHYAAHVVGRGDGTGTELAAAVPRHEELVVRYQRGACTEVYEVRAEGLKQSFVLHELPAGEGDLWVRGALATDLVVDGDGGRTPALDLRDRVLGSVVTIDGVVGIDARGARTAGWLRYDDGVLEVGLPASFVDRAQLPLVIDPLIGTSVALPPGSGANERPSIAWDRGSDVYLVVWQRTFSFSDSDVVGQRVAGDGTLLGSQLFVRKSTVTSARPAVASVASRGAFVVAYSEPVPGVGREVYARVVDAATGRMRDPVQLSFPTRWAPFGWNDNVDVGGDVSVGGDRLLFMLEAVGGDEVAQFTPFALPATLDANQDLTLGAPRYIGTTQAAFPNTPQARSRIARDRNGNGWLLVWQLRGGVVELVLLDPDATVISQRSTVVRGARPGYAVASDGEGWSFAFRVTGVVRGDTDVACARVEWRGGALVAGPSVLVANDPARREAVGELAFLGDSQALTYLQEEVFRGPWSLRVASLDPFSCGPCDGDLLVTPGLEAAATSTAMVAGGNGEALLAWTDPTAAPQREIRVQRYRADDGVVVDLGGGCGAGARASAVCAVAGNAGFTHRLDGAVPGAGALLLLGAGTLGLPCGSCTLQPDPATGAVLMAPAVDPSGRTALTTPLPASASLVGQSFIEQWVLLTPGGSCAIGPSELSNALRVTVE